MKTPKGKSSYIPFSEEAEVCKFAESISNCKDQGYYFVPIIGAGLSVPSGIPQAAMLNRYLSWCFFRALQLDPWADPKSKVLVANPNDAGVWSPRRGGWPDMASEIGKSGIRQTVSNQRMDSILKAAIDLMERGEDFKCPEGGLQRVSLSLEIIREVYGALADWRSALLLLSRIALVEEFGSGPRYKLVLTAPDNSVVDSFFQFLMRGRQPCLGHRMIAVLTPILRMNVLLTSNFDDLIERAFSSIGLPQVRFEVPDEVSLPDARLVTRQRSLVKMHGGAFGLRANYSTDATPEFGDHLNFLGYLAGRPVGDIESKLSNRVALIICGVSGNDQRVISLIRHALERFPHLKIFWFCHTSWDVQSVMRHFPRPSSSRKLGDLCAIKNLFWVRHIDYGDLLAQIYQRCTNSVPPSGIQFPASWNLSSGPRIPQPKGTYKICFQTMQLKLTSTVETQLAVANNRRPILIPLYHGARGGVTLLSNLFWNCPRNIISGANIGTPVFPIWLDLEDVATPAGVFLRLALLLAKRGGNGNPISSLPLADFYQGENKGEWNFRDVLVSAFRDHHSRTGECLLVCINAQEAVGNYSPFKAEDWQANTDVYKQSLSLVIEYPWGAGRYLKRMIDLLVELNRDPANGVQFVIVARQPLDPKSNLLANFFTTLIQSTSDGRSSFLAFPEASSDTRPDLQITTNLTPFCPDEIVKKVKQWALEKPRDGQDRKLFLYVVMGFRFGRFEAGIIRVMEQIWKENPAGGLDSCRILDDDASRVREWINYLAEMGAVRWKAGSVIWIDGTIRSKILEWSEKQFSPDVRLMINSMQARWCGRLLLATSDPLAAAEVVYHAFHGVSQYLESLSKLTTRPKDQSTSPENRVFATLRHAHSVINTAQSVLEDQLTDQFADHTLVLAQASAESVLKSLEKCKELLTNHAAICNEVTIIHDEIFAFRISLYLQEGEFQNLLLNYPQPVPRGVVRLLGGKQSGFLSAMIRLDKATALYCLRDYKSAEVAFNTLWEEYLGAIPSGIGSGREHARNLISLVISAGHSGCMNRHALALKCEDWTRFVVRLCRRHVYFLLVRGHAAWLNPKKKSNARKSARCNDLEMADWIGDIGQEVLRAIPATNDRFVYDENVRLRAHVALVRALRGFHKSREKERCSDFRAAHALLCDAESFIEEFPLQDGKIGRVILELRRAEILIVQSGEGTWLAEIRKVLAEVANHRLELVNLDRLKLDKVYAKKIDKKRKKFFPVKSSEFTVAIYERIAVIYDAIRYLDRCEIELHNHPKNRWWWWIHLVLKVHAIEGLYVLRLMLPRESIAGYERIIMPSLTRFVCSEIQASIKRVGLTEPFQLARILRSYRRILAAQRLYKVMGSINNKYPNQNSKAIYSDNATYQKVYRELSLQLAKALKDRNGLNSELKKRKQRLIGNNVDTPGSEINLEAAGDNVDDFLQELDVSSDVINFVKGCLRDAERTGLFVSDD